MNRRQLKKHIHVLGIDDGPHERGKKDVILLGTCMRGSSVFEGIMKTTIERDGDDATDKIRMMIEQSYFKSRLRCIFLDGIAVGGFNIIDLRSLYESLRIPIIVIMRKSPDLIAMRRAMEGIGKDFRIIEGSPEIEACNGIFIQRVGIDMERARKVLFACTSNSKIPEALRISHLVGAGMILGHSKGEP